MEQNLRRLVEKRGYSKVKDQARIKALADDFFHRLPYDIVVDFFHSLQKNPDPCRAFAFSEVTGPDKTTNHTFVLFQLTFNNGENWTFCLHEEKNLTPAAAESLFLSMYLLPLTPNFRKPKAFLNKLLQMIKLDAPLVMCKFQYLPAGDFAWKQQSLLFHNCPKSSVPRQLFELFQQVEQLSARKKQPHELRLA